MADRTDRIERHRGAFRALLIALGAPLAGIGAWALLAPRSFYDDFPADGRDWVSALGPFNEHLVRDFGALYLAVGLLLCAAGVLLGRQLVQAALVTLLVVQIPHLIFHASETEAFGTGDNVANLAAISLPVLVSAVLLALTMRHAPRRPAATPATTTPEGGMPYGTR